MNRFQRMEERKLALEAERQEALDRFTNLDFKREFVEIFPEPWDSDETLLFSDNAKMRLQQVAGFIRGLSHGDEANVRRATQIAFGLDKKLKYLSTYGGTIDTSAFKPIPHYKVVLFDGGKLNQFHIDWYIVCPERYSAEYLVSPPDESILLHNKSINGLHKFQLWTQRHWKGESVQFDYRYKGSGSLMLHGYGPAIPALTSMMGKRTAQVFTDLHLDWSIHT